LTKIRNWEKGVVYKPAKGVSKPANAVEVDHILPKSAGGSNSFSNARVVFWKTNPAKSNALSYDLGKSLGGLPDIGSVSKAITLGVPEIFRDYHNFRVGVNR
jgi:hypothetical protein